MELVLAFRRFERPIRFDEFRGIRARAPWCFDVYRLTYHGSFLSSDGRRMVCRYTAPDAEAVRIPSRQYEVPFERITAVEPEGPAHNEATGDLRTHLSSGEHMIAIEAGALPTPDSVDMYAGHLLTYRARDGLGDLHLYAGRTVPAARNIALLPAAAIWAAALHLPAAHSRSAIP